MLRGPLVVWVCVAAVCVTLSRAHIKQHRILKTTEIDNCTVVEQEASDFPIDLFTVDERRHGAIGLHVLCGLYCFIIIAFVCNDYFLPSVDCICQDLNLSKDVAGATFMAFATSAPELFVNVIGTFLTESDLGVGTVVGSAVFNTLGVAACGGLAAKAAIPLELWPLVRDCGIYASVVVVLTAILWDEKVEWYEALILLVLYLVYCIGLFCQQKLHKAAKSVLGKNKSFHSNNSTVALACSHDMATGTYRPFYFHGETIGWDMRPPSIRADDTSTAEQGSSQDNKTTSQKSKEQKAEEFEGVKMCAPPVKWLSRLWWAVSWPVAFTLYISIPDCRSRRTIYPATFLMCVIWIGVSSYVISWMMTVVGDTLGLSDSVMGLTLIAIGGSMPEASTSIINARLGIGSMTISNALGGNTLDILLSLGLPWFIKTLLPTHLNGGSVVIQSPNLVYNNATQLVGIAVLFGASYLNRLRMDRKLGVLFLIMYVVFIVIIVVMELRVSTSSKTGC